METIKNPDGQKTADVTRTTDGHLFVNVKRPAFSTFRMASGTGLSRLLQGISSTTDFMLITACRAYDEVDGSYIPRVKSQNARLFQQLAAELRSKVNSRVEAYWLVAHWTECSVDIEDAPLSECTGLGGYFVDSIESSWFFSKHDATAPDAWLNAAIQLATTYKQNGFVIRINGETTLRNQVGDVRKHLEATRAVENAWAELATLRGRRDVSFDFRPPDPRERARKQPGIFRHAAEAEAAASKQSAYHLAGTGKPHELEFFSG